MCCFSVFTPPPVCMPAPFMGCGPMPFMGCGPIFPLGGRCYNPGNSFMFGMGAGLGAGLGCLAGNIIGGLLNRWC